MEKQHRKSLDPCRPLWSRATIPALAKKKKITGKGAKTSPEKKNRFHKDDDSGSSKIFPREVIKEGGSKVTSNNFEKCVTKPGKKRCKNRKSDESAAKKPKWDDFKKKKELKHSRQLNDKTNYDTVLIQRKMKTTAFVHDSTCVIQCYIWYDDLVQLSKAKYFRDIMCYAYNDKAFLEQRNMLREELYFFFTSHFIMDEMKQILAPMAQKEAAIKRSLEQRVGNVANGQDFHLVLLAAFDCIDDTNFLPNIVDDKYGKKVLLYLLSPRDLAHSRNAHSKDTRIYPPELLESIFSALLSCLQGHVQEVVLDKFLCVLVSDILGVSIEDDQPAMNAIAKLEAGELHLGGKEESGRECSFAKTSVDHVGMKNLNLLQSSAQEVTKKVKAELKGLIPTLDKI
ncbi:unnamed protein product [Nyctereutes procyonoides]|uniref:(raccoon dog) hypothetical protein n=1 Tax=Nyctereutes procyonoides TaxID=34880 RepID=A0A811ZLL0_NYCPR|nr:unnamed protein product [Nyctereutes procyonoides]